MRRIVFYGAVLIGVYLALARATGGGRLLSAGGSATSAVVRAFQGR
jgi:hypothetical protein